MRYVRQTRRSTIGASGVAPVEMLAKALDAAGKVLFAIIEP